MAAKARLAELQGFAPDGLTIENPEQYVNSVLMRLINQRPSLVGVWRKKNPPSLEEYTGPADELTTLIEMPKDNMKQFVEVPDVGLRRLSASGKFNCCWFDAFLQCMSAQYNNLPLNDRVEVRKRFRVWCNDHVGDIIAQIPRDVFPAGAGGYLTDDEILYDLSDTEDEINAQTGMFIAWYFGVNCIVVHKQAGEYVVECQNAYQSPECKTIVIYFENAHFEPMGKFAVAPNNTNMNGKFLFDWSDIDLCLLKSLSLACENIDPWTAPTCGAAAGKTPAGTTPGKAPGSIPQTPNNTARTLQFGNNMKGNTASPAWNFMNAVEQAGASNGSAGAGGGAAEQRGGKRRRTRKRRIQKRRSQTKKRRSVMNKCRTSRK